MHEYDMFDDPKARVQVRAEALNDHKDNPGWLDKSIGTKHVLNGISARLAGLAIAFERTGNLSVARELFLASEDIEASREKISEFTSQCLNEALASSQTMTKAVVEAALAGCILGREDKKQS